MKYFLLIFCVCFQFTLGPVESVKNNERKLFVDIQTSLNDLFNFKLPIFNNKNNGISTSNNGGSSSATNTTEKSTCPISVKGNPTRPCPNNNVDCVSKFFQRRSDCEPFDSGDIGVLSIEHTRFNLPFFKVIIELNMTIFGLDGGKIDDFIVDDTTDLVVLTVSYKNISVTLHKAEYYYFETGKEPKLFAISPTIYFESFLITSTFSGSKSPQLSNSFHVGNLTALPQYTINVCSPYNDDPSITSLLKKFNENTKPAALEAFTTLARPFQSKYIRRKLCNFEEFNIDDL